MEKLHAEQYEIYHQPGTQNKNADGLSRGPPTASVSDQLSTSERGRDVTKLSINMQSGNHFSTLIYTLRTISNTLSCIVFLFLICKGYS